mgnify:CR=1 FL=1
MSLFLAIFLIFEVVRGTSIAWYAFPLAFLSAALVAVGDQKIKIGDTEVGGWLYVGIFFLAVYLATLHLRVLSFPEIWTAFVARLNDIYSLKVLVASRFKDAYIVIASASFTLVGLFFIIVRLRRFNTINASRLMSTGEAFLVVFALSVPALLFVEEPWWRWVLITIGNSTVLLFLVRDPEHWPIEYAKDSPVVIFFWNSWLKNRRGQGIAAAIGLALMPIAPAWGESLFFLSLFYTLYSAVYTAAFLYVSTELRAPDKAEALAKLFRIRIPRAELERIKEWKKPFENVAGFGGTDWVPFVPGQSPPGKK